MGERSEQSGMETNFIVFVDARYVELVTALVPSSMVSVNAALDWWYGSGTALN